MSKIFFARVCEPFMRLCARTRHLHACVRETRYYQRGSVVPNTAPLKRKEKKMLEMISRTQTSNTGGRLSYGASIDCENKGGRWLRGWKSWTQRKRWIDEADRRQAAPGSAANCARGPRLWGLCQSGSGGKVAPMRKGAEREMQGNVWGTEGLDDS